MKRLRMMAVTLSLFGIGSPVSAERLLSATVDVAESKQLEFSLSGESRENVIGGEVKLDDRAYEITKMSLRNLIGARRVEGAGDEESTDAEFAVFSSSFSTQTAVGKPWVAAREHVGCDTAYNSFLAVYRVAGADALAALGPIPYPALTDDVSNSDQSTVYCFSSAPP